MHTNLSDLEARAEALIEGTLARWLGAPLHPREVMIKLARAMEDRAEAAPADGRPIAPDRFAVHMHPEDAAPYLNDPDTLATLSRGLVQLAREAELVLMTAPVIEVVSDASLAPRSLGIDAGRAPLGDTRTIGHA